MTYELVDSHLHIWSDDADAYPWKPISGAEPPQVPGSAEWLLDLADRYAVRTAVAVQSRVYGYDNSYVAQSIGKYPDRIIGVGMVDLRADPHEQSRHLKRLGFRGLRVDALGDPDAWESPHLVQGLWRAAIEAELPIDLLIGSDQLGPLEPLLRSAPTVQVAIEHMALWGTKSTQGIDPLMALGKHDNVCVKLTLSDVSKDGPPFRDLHPHVRHLRDAFGAERLMWGSDMPWLGADAYPQTIEALASHMSFLTVSDLASIFSGTARRFWHLDD